MYLLDFILTEVTLNISKKQFEDSAFYAGVRNYVMPGIVSVPLTIKNLVR